jgi:hypothetical protein
MTARFVLHLREWEERTISIRLDDTTLNGETIEFAPAAPNPHDTVTRTRLSLLDVNDFGEDPVLCAREGRRIKFKDEEGEGEIEGGEVEERERERRDEYEREAIPQSNV